MSSINIGMKSPWSIMSHVKTTGATRSQDAKDPQGLLH